MRSRAAVVGGRLLAGCIRRFVAAPNSSLQPNETAAPAWWVLKWRGRFRRLSYRPLGATCEMY